MAENPLSVEEDFYIEAKPQKQLVEQCESDVEYVRNNLYNTLKVPKK
jgi:hypothetical protein